MLDPVDIVFVRHTFLRETARLSDEVVEQFWKDRSERFFDTFEKLPTWGPDVASALRSCFKP
jgi:hypothetical protein